MSQYLDSVREIERRIQQAEQQDAQRDFPSRSSAQWECPRHGKTTSKLMFDLQVLALQADITRVITFQLAREVSTRTYPQIGVAGCRTTRCRTTATIRRSSPSWPRSTRITCRCSRISSRG